VVFTNGEDLAVGSDLFLIGYPAESLPFPQPAISGGVLSRFREWEALEITYFQTATAIAGGQSGGGPFRACSLGCGCHASGRGIDRWR